jgi:hypothetical protein
MNKAMVLQTMAAKVMMKLPECHRRLQYLQQHAVKNRWQVRRKQNLNHCHTLPSILTVAGPVTTSSV